MAEIDSETDEPDEAKFSFRALGGEVVLRNRMRNRGR